MSGRRVALLVDDSQRDGTEVRATLECRPDPTSDVDPENLGVVIQEEHDGGRSGSGSSIPARGDPDIGGQHNHLAVVGRRLRPVPDDRRTNGDRHLGTTGPQRAGEHLGTVTHREDDEIDAERLHRVGHGP